MNLPGSSENSWSAAKSAFVSAVDTLR
jgi:hypothetical protein